MRRLLSALALVTLVSALSGCPFFTRDDDSQEPPAAAEPGGAEAPAPADEHAGHGHE